MRRSLGVPGLVLAAAFAASLAALPADAQTPGFAGTYKLTLRFGSSCQTQIASLSFLLQVKETVVTRGSEITGRPARPDENSVAEITLMRSGSTLHGPVSTQGGRTEREPITSLEGWLFMPWLVLDGSVTTSGGRGQAQGTAFGFLAAGGTEEDYPSSLARCTATDFSWQLDPQ
jgi:hypothetical protein